VPLGAENTTDIGGSLLLKQEDLLVGSPAEPAAGLNKPAETSERRKSARFAVSASADILELRTRTHLSGRASDLGAGGCYVDTVTPFPVGTSVVLNLTSENHTVHAMANVVYAHTGMGMGLAFAEMTPTQKANLSTWLRELSGEPPKAEAPSEADMPYLQEATIREPAVHTKGAGLLDAMQELVSLLGNKRVLTEAEVEVLRDKMAE
jgi:PilZ domain